MAYDKIVDSVQLDANLTSIANAIRGKNGTSEQISFPDGFVTAINALETGGSAELFGVIHQAGVLTIVSGVMVTQGENALSIGG